MAIRGLRNELTTGNSQMTGNQYFPKIVKEEQKAQFFWFIEQTEKLFSSEQSKDREVLHHKNTIVI